MLIIVDEKIPGGAKRKLSLLAGERQGLLVELQTSDLVYPAISGHPDIFFCQTPQKLVVSPNLPDRYIRILSEHNSDFICGSRSVGALGLTEEESLQSIPLSKRKNLENRANTCYNAVISKHYLVHRLEYTDPVILENCHYLKKIAVRQAYTRCNLMLLKENHYITSDQGIDKVLRKAGLKGFCSDSREVLLPGFPNGFIGGALGVYEETVYINGALGSLSEGRKIHDFLSQLDYRVVELHDGSLFDGGGILFI